MMQVLSAYPGKEVKKGLADLYRKVEKHLSEEENLLQVQYLELKGFFSIFKSVYKNIDYEEYEDDI